MVFPMSEQATAKVSPSTKDTIMLGDLRSNTFPKSTAAPGATGRRASGGGGGHHHRRRSSAHGMKHKRQASTASSLLTEAVERMEPITRWGPLGR